MFGWTFSCATVALLLRLSDCSKQISEFNQELHLIQMHLIILSSYKET